jgi:hypothetical protein
MNKYIVRNSKLKNYLSSLGFKFEVSAAQTEVYIFKFKIEEHYLFYRALSFYYEFEREKSIGL